jgi:glycosyltransferase involved in cell wall biosynthesis
MPRLAVLCDHVGDDGGAERYWETVVPGLVARGIDVHLFARRVSAGSVRFAAPARQIAWSDEDGTPSDDAGRMVAEALRDFRPDTIVTASVFDTAVLDAVRAAGPRWLARVHDHRVFCPTGDRVYPQFSAPCTNAMGTSCRTATLLRGCVHGPRTSSIDAIRARDAVRERIVSADGVLVSSRHMVTISTTNGVAANRITITPPPLPDDAFSSDDRSIPAARSIVFAGRLTPRKGLRSLVRALSRLSKTTRPQLIVAGEGEIEERAARADATRLGVAVDWRGRQTAAQLRRAYDEAAVVAVPSLWPEPFGLVGIEAQARGRPAVAYDVGGIGDWIGDAGITAPRGDEAALAAAIDRIFDHATWTSLAARARERAESYRLDTHLDRLLTLLWERDFRT